MVNKSENILVSGDAILTLAIGALPKSKWAKSVTAALAPEFAGGEIGFITEDGEALSRTVETSTINMHQQNSVRTIITGGEQTLTFAAGETNKLILDLYHGATLSSEGYRIVKAGKATTVTFNYDAYDIQDGFEKRVRYAGIGLLTPNGEVTYTATGVTSYPFTLSIMGDMYQSDQLVAIEDGE